MDADSEVLELVELVDVDRDVLVDWDVLLVEMLLEVLEVEVVSDIVVLIEVELVLIDDDVDVDWLVLEVETDNEVLELVELVDIEDEVLVVVVGSPLVTSSSIE